MGQTARCRRPPAPCGILNSMKAEATRTHAHICRIIQAGCLPYREAWAWQRQLAAERSAGRGDDTLLLLEHPPTITLGRKADRGNILVSADELAHQGIALVETDRGGDVTFHAPGQLVGYPIVKVSRYGASLLHYLRNLEEVLIRVLADYGLAAERIAGLTGVWLPACNAKIAAVGVKLSASGVSTHGFALNIAPDLHGFRQIIPCGIRDREVTSMQQVLGTPPPLPEVRERVIAHFRAVFAVELVLASENEPDAMRTIHSER